MAVKIRLKRMGSKKNPFYRMVAADGRAPRDGRYIEELGYYNPLTKELKLDNEKAGGWLKNGAQPTDTARALLKRSGALVDSAETAAARAARGAAMAAAGQGVTAEETPAEASVPAAKAEEAPAEEKKAEPAAEEKAEEPAVEEAAEEKAEEPAGQEK